MPIRTTIPAIGALLLPLPAAAQQPTFELAVIDQSMAGDCKMAGDIDGDGHPDAVVGGDVGEDLVWYRWPDWNKTTVAIPGEQFTTDGELGDIDSDGDLDIVVPDGPSGDNLLWFENPLPTGDPTDGSQWTRRVVGRLGTWGKDVEVADYDGDGETDIAARTHSAVFIFFQNNGSWTREVMKTGQTGEGMASGDIDNDGDDDLVLRGIWIENPEPAGDAATDNWTTHTIVTNLYASFKSLIADLDGNGQPEVIYSNSESTGDVIRYYPASGDPRGSWSSSVIVPSLNRCHTLQADDFDLDGSTDLVLGQMHTSSAQEISVYLNNENASSWTKIVVDDTGIHNGVVADFGLDGAPDIFGCNWTGNPPVHVWTNMTGADCAADVTTTNASQGDPGFGKPDGAVTVADLQFFVNAWIALDPLTDITTAGTAQGQPGYGEPDAEVTTADLLFYVNLWVAGCP